ncbi:hypothetical protein M378DRAFT_79706, partial [Amanita muscaria Koide BX008]
MIALCRAKCWIIQLNEQQADSDLHFPHVQRGFHGNIIIYPQHPQRIATILPPSVEEITSPICVIFVGSSPPSYEWLRDKAKPLAVRGNKVRQALMWLKAHNPLYADIEINYNVLNNLPVNGLLPFHVEHVSPNKDGDVLTSRYDVSASTSEFHAEVAPPPDAEISFQKIVISDVDAAALRHMRKKKGGYLKLPHDANPENEFVNPNLFPKIYPTLFPFGVGGLEDHSRKEAISFQRHVKHLLK